MLCSWAAQIWSLRWDGDKKGCRCYGVACLSYKCSPSETDGRLIGNNGTLSRALVRLSTRESLTSSEGQLAFQAKMHRREMKLACGGFIFIPGFWSEVQFEPFVPLSCVPQVDGSVACRMLSSEPHILLRLLLSEYSLVHVLRLCAPQG